MGYLALRDSKERNHMNLTRDIDQMLGLLKQKEVPQEFIDSLEYLKSAYRDRFSSEIERSDVSPRPEDEGAS